MYSELIHNLIMWTTHERWGWNAPQLFYSSSVIVRKTINSRTFLIVKINRIETQKIQFKIPPIQWGKPFMTTTVHWTVPAWCINRIYLAIPSWCIHSNQITRNTRLRTATKAYWSSILFSASPLTLRNP